MSLVDIATLQAIAETEFADIVASVDSETNRMRVYLTDESFLDVWYSLENEGRYSYQLPTQPPPSPDPTAVE